MNKFKKLAFMGLGLLMCASVFAGCSADGLKLYNAFSKSQTIKSMEMQTDISLNVTATNLSDKEKQLMMTVLPMINSSKISMLTKTVGNKDNTVAKMESNINLDLGGMSINTGIWADVNTKADKPVIKAVIKMPQILTAQVPELNGKEYLVMDLDDMTSMPGQSPVDYKKIMTLSKELQPKLTNFLNAYIKQYNPTVNVVNKVGTKDIVQGNKTQSADIYEVKLNDKTFKALLRYTVNNFAKNKDAMNFVKDYMLASISAVGTQGEQAINKAEIEKVFDTALTQLPEAMKEINKKLDSLDKLTILGKRGISIKYAVNKDGYIINEEGSAEFVLDIPSINKLAGEATSTDHTGIYTITVDFKNDIRNINGNVTVALPNTNADNSINYVDLIGQDALNNAKKLIKTAKTTKTLSAYKNACDAVNKLPKSHKEKLAPELATVAKLVYTKDVVKIINTMKEYSNAKDLKKYYYIKGLIDSSVVVSENRKYLQNELNLWSGKEVFTTEVVDAINAISIARNKKDPKSIKAAEAAIKKVKNKVNNQWLKDNLTK